MESMLGMVRHSGNESLFSAIEMSLLAALSGHPLHLHAEGLRGTGKTSIMRGVRRILPKIRRVKGCLYNCDPARPHCPVHRELSQAELSALGDEWVPMPFLEISHSAKVGTVVGSIDLGRLVDPAHPEAALLPGTIPQAHRGILFVDEINRLAETAPELADILLDVMGTKPGRVQIEETGLPAVELPAQVTVWAASNPDEDPGPLDDIRRQLSDRFDFVIFTDRPGDRAVVEQILESAVGQGLHRAFSLADGTRVELFRTRLLGRTINLPGVQVPSTQRGQIADLYSRFQVESLRAVQAIYCGMRLAACLDDRKETTAADLARVIPMALRHRVDPETMKKITTHLSGSGVKQEQEASPAQALRHRLAGAGSGAVPAGQAVQLAQPVDLAANGTVGRTSESLVPGAPEGSALARSAAGSAGRPRMAGGTVGAETMAVEASPRSTTWLHRTLEGLRRNLGMASPSPARRPEQRLGQQQDQPPDLRPDQGRGPQPGSGLRPEHDSRKTQSRNAEMQSRDPLKDPPDSPPHVARPLAVLEPAEFIRTEEELSRP